MKIPILRLEEILLTSIQVDLTDTEVMEFQSNVLHTIAEVEARGLAIDITAMEVIDSFMARTINDTANMAQLLGAEVVVCGMHPAVALTLIEMGRGLIGVETTFNLSEGLFRLRKRIARRGDSALREGDHHERAI